MTRPHTVRKFARIAISRPGKGVLVVSKGKGHPFNLVGGKLKKGEHPKKAALREMREEIGGKVKISAPTLHSEHITGELQRSRITKKLRLLGAELTTVYAAKLLKNGHPHTKHEIRRKKWVTPKNIEKPKRKSKQKAWLAPEAEAATRLLWKRRSKPSQRVLRKKSE